MKVVDLRSVKTLLIIICEIKLRVVTILEDEAHFQSWFLFATSSGSIQLPIKAAEEEHPHARFAPRKLANPGAQGATAVIRPPAMFLS